MSANATDGTVIDITLMGRFVGGNVHGQMVRTTDGQVTNPHMLGGRITHLDLVDGQIVFTIQVDGRQDDRQFPLHSATVERAGDDLVLWIPGVGVTTRKLTFSPPQP